MWELAQIIRISKEYKRGTYMWELAQIIRRTYGIKLV